VTPEQRDLIQLLLDNDVLRFGDFVLKSGNRSPYFLNLGLVADGHSLSRLAEFYARKIAEDIGPETCDVLFGPAYKGIPLAAATAMSLAERFEANLPFAFDRKQAKGHAEGGRLVGHPIGEGARVLMIDDVLTSGGTKLEAIDLLRQEARAEVVGILICVDRMEPAQDGRTQVEAFAQQTGIPVHSLLCRADIEQFVGRSLTGDA